MFNNRSLRVALDLVAIAGIAMVALFVSLQKLLQAAVPDRYRGRILGGFGTTTGSCCLSAGVRRPSSETRSVRQ